MLFARPLPALIGLTGLLAAAGFIGSDATAQQIFRSVGPDGRVTFSDQPSPETGSRAVTPIVLRTPGAAADHSAVPFAPRQVATRYPVTLYSGPGCAPCASGRVLLLGRGVPFTEMTVSTQEDIDALKRLSGTATLPFVTIGGQHIKGFSEVEWTQFLDAAGYPKTSQLPSSYSPPAALPLVAVQQPPQRAPSDAAAKPDRAIPPEPPLPSAAEHPSGIRF
jgi:glutaredoxin